MNLKSLLPEGTTVPLLPATPVLLAHLMQWFQPGNSHCSNTGVTYDSSDPLQIACQVRLAQSLGIDGFIVDWYGPSTVNPFGDLAFRNLLLVASVLGNFRAGICIDKGACQALVSKGATWQSAFDQCISYIKQNYSQNPAFFSDYILEFGCGQKAIDAGSPINFSAYPNLLHDSAKFGLYYTWALPNAQAQAQHYSDPNCIMGSVCAHFNDTNVSKPATGIWGGAPRFMDSNLTMSNWHQGWQLITPKMKYIQIVTWNDYEERTAVEGELGMLGGF